MPSTSWFYLLNFLSYVSQFHVAYFDLQEYIYHF